MMMVLEIDAAYVAHTNYPWWVVCPFSMPNQKKVTSWIDQLLITSKEGLSRSMGLAYKNTSEPFLFVSILGVIEEISTSSSSLSNFNTWKVGLIGNQLHRNIHNLGCTKSCVFPNVFFFNLVVVDKLQLIMQ